MADIKLVITISEEEYANIKKALNSLIENGVDLAHMSKVCLAVKNGTPLPKEQHWERMLDRFGRHLIRCSGCKYFEPEYLTNSRKYCPNCGAPMRVEE